MGKYNFWSDMALDHLENYKMESVASHKKLPYGVVESVVNLKNKILADRVGKPQGVYVTYDTSGADSPAYAEHLSKVMSSVLRQLIGGLAHKSVVLAVGLGNGQVLADSLGLRVMSKINPTRGGHIDSKFNLCCHSLGVQGATGIKSREVLGALVDKLNPSAIIVVDSLATASARRLGMSFQVSTAGIVPGGGIGMGRAPINKQVFGVPTVSIGVPMVLTMQGVINEVAKALDVTDKHRVYGVVCDMDLNGLIVAPKEVKIFIENASNIIAEAINLAYSK